MSEEVAMSDANLREIQRLRTALTNAQRQQWYRQDRAWAARKRLRILRGK